MSNQRYLPEYASIHSKLMIHDLYASCQSECITVADLLVDAAEGFGPIKDARDLDEFLLTVLDEIADSVNWAKQKIRRGKEIDDKLGR